MSIDHHAQHHELCRKCESQNLLCKLIHYYHETPTTSPMQNVVAGGDTISTVCASHESVWKETTQQQPEQKDSSDHNMQRVKFALGSICTASVPLLVCLTLFAAMVILLATAKCGLYTRVPSKFAQGNCGKCEILRGCRIH